MQQNTLNASDKLRKFDRRNKQDEDGFDELRALVVGAQAAVSSAQDAAIVDENIDRLGRMIDRWRR